MRHGSKYSLVLVVAGFVCRFCSVQAETKSLRDHSTRALEQDGVEEGGRGRGGGGAGGNRGGGGRGGKTAYEVWGSDQSNSEADLESLGVSGGFLWIWDSESITQQLSGNAMAKPLPCAPGAAAGPCDMWDMFPRSLVEGAAQGQAQAQGQGQGQGQTLGALGKFGRIHGVQKDPTDRYVTANMFVGGGGYVGIIDTRTKGAVGLFRVTEVSFDGASTGARSVHMSLWTADGSAVIVCNLNGKAIERINVGRDANGDIVNLEFDLGASIGLGKQMSIANAATFFTGKNGLGNDLVPSTVTGSYSSDAFGDLTPNQVCKERGCGGGNGDGQAGGRPNNLVICPITTANGLAYVTLAGGGLFVLDSASTPMKIVGEYGQGVVYGAGCGGVELKSGKVIVNAGVSASSAGATQSMFAVYAFDDSKYKNGPNPENTPMPARIFSDGGNTRTGGNVEGGKGSDESGQIPGVTTRRDSHGAAATLDGRFVHINDRIQNVVEVFDVMTHERTTYDLVSKNGKSGRSGPAGPCFAKSVLDDGGLPLNDPAPDLMDLTPDGKYFMVAFRGPAPVSVEHAGQGSCPGVGIIEITDGGRSGKLVDVLRATNVVPDKLGTITISGGRDYVGKERADVHGAIVVFK